MVNLRGYDFKLDNVTEVKAMDTLFAAPENKGLIHLVLCTYLEKGRAKTAKVKTRAEVAGGGKKPWKQKGTGRARAGTTRSPIWVGGGVAFGPTNIKRHIKINKKVMRKALLSALSTKTELVRVVMNDNLFTDKISKVKHFSELLIKLDVAIGKTLYITKTPHEREAVIGNIENLIIKSVYGLNIWDILRCKSIVFEESALKQVEECYIDV